MGLTKAEHPTIINTLNVLLPTILPIEISLLPFNADIKLVTNSGNDVPKATTVKPITISVTLNRRAKPVAPSVNLSAPSNTSAIPTTSNTTVKNIPSAF